MTLEQEARAAYQALGGPNMADPRRRIVPDPEWATPEPDEPETGVAGGGWAGQGDDPSQHDLDRGSGPNAYPTVIRDANGRAVDVG